MSCFATPFTGQTRLTKPFFTLFIGHGNLRFTAIIIAVIIATAVWIIPERRAEQVIKKQHQH